MKKELLEYLIRECVKEVLEIAAEDPTIGAPAPPEAGQGTADQPEIPKPETSSVPFFTTQPKGVWFVDPKKPKPTQLTFQAKDPRSIEQTIYRAASRVGGPNIQTSDIATRKAVEQAVQNPNAGLFLYVGKPENSETLTVLSAPTYEKAKEGAEAAVGASAERGVTAISSDPTDPEGMVKNWQTKQAGGKTLAPDIDEANQFRSMISSMIKEALSDMTKKS